MKLCRIGDLGVEKPALIDNENNADHTANYYTNGDFTTVNGFEFTLRTRRINRLQTF